MFSYVGGSNIVGNFVVTRISQRYLMGGIVLMMRMATFSISFPSMQHDTLKFIRLTLHIVGRVENLNHIANIWCIFCDGCLMECRHGALHFTCLLLRRYAILLYEILLYAMLLFAFLLPLRIKLKNRQIIFWTVLVGFSVSRWLFIFFFDSGLGLGCDVNNQARKKQKK